MQADETKQTQVVNVRSAHVVVFQTYNEFVTFDASRQCYTDTANDMLSDSIYEESHISHYLTYPIGIWSLVYRPFEYVLLMDAFQESVKCVFVRQQARFVEVSTTAVAG